MKMILMRAFYAKFLIGRYDNFILTRSVEKKYGDSRKLRGLAMSHDKFRAGEHARDAGHQQYRSENRASSSSFLAYRHLIKFVGCHIKKYFSHVRI